MVQYMEAIKKPFQDLQTAAIGIVIGMVPILNLIMTGYAVGVARDTANKNNTLPKWSTNKIGQYIGDTISAIAIEIGYLVPSIILLLGGLLLVFGGAISGIISATLQGNPQAAQTALTGLALGGATAIIGMILVALGTILAIIGAVFAPMGIMFYIKEGTIGAAFQFSKVMKKVMTGKYLITLAVVLVYGFIVSMALTIITLPLWIIPLIGPLIGGGIITYMLAVTSYTLYAEVFNETP